ncbi:MAG: AMP-binding protein [Gammaproteobacteria bacterium]|nr:AMP-binding protein [Gammaproteobacteria bacterium]
MSLCRRLAGHSQYQPDKPAIVFEEGQITYHQLNVLTQHCIEYFKQLGLETGDRVALLSMNHPDWFIALFAAAQTGIVLVPLNWRLSVDELSYVIQDSTPKLLFFDEAFADAARQLANSHSMHTQRIGTHEFPSGCDEPSTQAIDLGSAVPEESDLLIVYTSGTTGRPKGAVLSQRALLCSAAMSQHMLDLTPYDRVLNVLPLFHVGGLNIQPLPALLYGATLHLQAKFDPECAVRSLESDQITLINSVPTVLRAMVDTSHWSSANFNALRAVSIGSSDVPLPLIRQVHERGLKLIQVYGTTETSPTAIYQRIEQAHMEGSIGRSGLLNDVRLVSPDGRDVPIGESGEILVRGENVLSRYWNNPDATEQCLEDGWFKTGDMAHQDESGFYWFDDRVKHVVISGGENIYPAELERVIREIPGIGDLAVVGQKDDRWGEVPVVAVVADGSINAETILASCDSLAKFKRPKDVFFVDSMPRNALGKIQIHELKKQLFGELTQ